MGKTYTVDEVNRGSNMPPYTQAEKEAIVAEWNAFEAKSGERKLKDIREIRFEKLKETDYLALSDTTLSVAMTNYRQGLRDIPANYTDEAAYDLVLARNGDGDLTHSVWTKPE
jgi:hypothetical protein